MGVILIMLMKTPFIAFDKIQKTYDHNDHKLLNEF